LTLYNDIADGGNTPPMLKLVDTDNDTTADTKMVILFSKAQSAGSFVDAGKILVAPSQWGGSSGLRHTYMAFHTVFNGSSNERLRITDEGDIYSDTANAKISGSSTSTGSFGTVEASHFTGDGAGLTNVPDYVFESEYVLRSLSDVEEFVSESKHLPGIPSMDDMSEWKKYSVGDRDMLLLEKIEELTLYVIRLEKRIKDLENN
jgi:hypothetical protein